MSLSEEFILRSLPTLGVAATASFAMASFGWACIGYFIPAAVFSGCTVGAGILTQRLRTWKPKVETFVAMPVKQEPPEPH